ncbi:hypothetical protein AXG93_2818s1140 [Marchantia polymorpha subsp. ruderalis]|uniref:Uncharacterized protein n=1 Tax=Marchantia polymorpha subsp. ruderalis TaxID=1480154 RepID=A0A176VXE8_MARPO|nr:hypothetical protein AXG93_2818s1140 [Marchantia polymorpha subsp. ruderalis]
MESTSYLRGRIPSVLLAALVLALSRLQSTGALDILFWPQIFTGTVCASGAKFTGARWNPICRRRQLLADVSDDEQQACTDASSGCKKLVDPNALVYNSGEGNWVLITDNAIWLYEQLKNVPDSEKVAWLTAQGATYTSKTE